MRTIKLDVTAYAGLKLKDLRKSAETYYKANLTGTMVMNVATGVVITFANSGLRHVLYGRTGGNEKYYAVFAVKALVAGAEFSNFKNRDKDDAPPTLGYMHLKAKLTIDSKVYPYRIVIRIMKNGKYYYDHSVRIKK